MKITHITITPVDNGWIVNTEYERGYAQDGGKIITSVFNSEKDVMEFLWKILDTDRKN